MTARLEFIDGFPPIYLNHSQTKRCLSRRKGNKNQQLACCLFSLPSPHISTLLQQFDYSKYYILNLSSENEDYGNISHQLLKIKKNRIV